MSDKQGQTGAVIIGAGPAGLTAAIYLRRAGISATVVEKLPAGGQVGILTRIANYPGVPETTGYELIEKMTAQARSFGCEFAAGEVVALDPVARLVTLRSGRKIPASAVLVATGVRPKRLGVLREDELVGRGVSYCATCDGHFYRGKTVAVAGGQRARGAAAYLSRIAGKVYFVTEEGGAPEGTEEVVGRVVGLIGTPLSAIRTAGEEGERELPADGLFVSAGYEPNTDILRGKVELDGEYYVRVNERMETSDPWIYAAGDITAKEVRQIVTAAADGAIAASAIARALRR